MKNNSRKLKENNLLEIKNSTTNKDAIDKVNIERIEKCENFENLPSYKLNSWYFLLSNIIYAIVFTSIKINFMNLNYILPTIGTYMFFLSFNKIKNENIYFKILWKFSIINMITNIFYFILLAMPWFAKIENSMFFIFAISSFKIISIIIFNDGLIDICNRENISYDFNFDKLAISLEIFLVLVALFDMNYNFLVVLIYFIVFLLILISLFNIRYSLRNIQYNSYSKIKTRKKYIYLFVYIIICFTAITISSIFANHTVLEYKKLEETNNIDDNKIKINLINLGFPQKIIDQISHENISRLQNASNIDVSYEVFDFNYSNKTNNKLKNNSMLYMTTIYIEMEDGSLYAINYFNWRKNNAFWNDLLSISCNNNIELIDGKIIFTKDNINYTSDFINKLFDKNIMIYSFNDEIQNFEYISYPFNTKNHRGYIFYKINLPKIENSSMYQISNNSSILYYHATNPFTFPYKDKYERMNSTTYIFHRYISNYIIKNNDINFKVNIIQ